MVPIRCLLVLVALTVLAPATRAQEARGIRWLHDLDDALARSAETGQPVIAYFTFNTCSWCKKLEAETYSDPEVISRSRDFVWVKVNRDVTPEIPEQFCVTAYPSLITLGLNREKIHRFSGFRTPEQFLPMLDEALARYARYKAGEEWEPEPSRPDSICEAGEVELLKAPSEEGPSGLCVLDGDLWVMQRPVLYRMSIETGRVLGKHRIAGEELAVDICTDGESIYIAPYGWSAGQAIRVLDPETGEIERRIVTEENKAFKVFATSGMEWLEGRLLVVSSGEVNVVDPETGAIERKFRPGPRISGLASHDGLLVSGVAIGEQTGLVFISPQDGAIVRRVPTNYGVRSVASDGVSLFLMEQPVWDYDKENRRVQVWPRIGETMIYRLRLDERRP